MSNSDCLVVKIDEMFSFDVEHTIFIVYDVREQKYVMRGKRFENIEKINYEPFSDSFLFHAFEYIFPNKKEKNSVSYYPYSFSCSKKESLVDFLDFIFSQGSSFRIRLYNYDNLPYDSKNITYDFFDSHVDKAYEIGSVFDYHGENKIKQRFDKILDLIQNVCNDYVEYRGDEEYYEEEEEYYEDDDYYEEDEEDEEDAKDEDGEKKEEDGYEEYDNGYQRMC